MVVNPLEVTFSPMLPQPGFFFAKVVVRKELPRSSTLLVYSLLPNIFVQSLIYPSLDMAEREATYIITNGGINDPEKA
jgi:hypothetical protein